MQLRILELGDEVGEKQKKMCRGRESKMSKHLRAYFFQMEKVENFFLLVADVFTQEVKTLLKNRFYFENNLWDERMP